MSQSSNILPCPFCGSTDLVVRTYGGLYESLPECYIVCHGCEATGPITGSKSWAVRKWNHPGRSKKI